MGFKTTNFKSWSKQKYVVAVLWMEGRLSTNEIAQQVRWTGGQVRGFYTQEFNPPRVNMSKEERQDALNSLKELRSWFGTFVDKRFDDRFRAKETRSERLAIEQQQAAKDRAERQQAIERGEMPAKPTKKDLRRFEQEQAHKTRQAAKERAERELGYAPRGRDTDALEWLALNALGDKGEALSGGALASRDRRKEALLKLRVHIEGASISPLRAQDYEAARGAGRRIALPEFRKHCIDMLGGARAVLPGWLYPALEAVVMQDEFIWNDAKSPRERGLVFEAVRFGADILATYYQIITRHEFTARWNSEAPIVSMPSRNQARDDSKRAQEIIDELTRAVA